MSYIHVRFWKLSIINIEHIDIWRICRDITVTRVPDYKYNNDQKRPRCVKQYTHHFKKALKLNHHEHPQQNKVRKMLNNL